MPSLGFGELLLIGIILLLVVGPERLPHATRTLGRAYGKMRRAADELRRALVLEADRLDEELRLKDLLKRREEAEDARRRMEQEQGAHAQPDPSMVRVGSEEDHEPDDDAYDGADEADGPVPPGFTREEWRELPPHIRDIVSRRRSTP